MRLSWHLFFVALISIFFGAACLIEFFKILIAIRADVRQLVKRQLDNESPEIVQERYNREMHYLESLIYHVAYREGRVSQDRIFELIPEAKRCHTCRKQVSLVFKYGLMRRDILMDVNTGSVFITPHVRHLIESTDFFKGPELAWILPAKKIIFSHGACHLFAIN